MVANTVTAMGKPKGSGGNFKAVRKGTRKFHLLLYYFDYLN